MQNTEFKETKEIKLRSGEEAANYDVMIFRNWERGCMPITRCLEEFKINNKIDTEISEDIFLEFLYNLGWGVDEL